MSQLGQDALYLCPQLPASPQLAIEQVQALVAGVPAPELVLIGSSLGGYYATWLAEQLGCRAALLNPAVAAPRDLAPHIGVLPAWHSDEPFEFKPEYVDQLHAMAVARITRPDRYFLLAATGDEVLDWREMVAHYPGARQNIIEGSDHGLSDFEHYMDEVLTWCGIEIRK